MATEIRVPTLGESVSEATIARWFKQPGEAVKADEPLVELETDKVTLEVNAPASGVLGDIVAQEGETVEPDALLGSIDEGGSAAAAPAKKEEKKEEKKDAPKAESKPEAAKPAPAAKASDHGPAVSRLSAESGVDPANVPGSGKDSRVTKGDMLAAIATGGASAPSSAPPQQARPASAPVDADREERVRMTKLRQTIARRLKDAQNTAAMLTTFNDVDMGAVMDLRKQYKDIFEKKHGVKLGFMGFFTKAVVQALKEVPAVNAEIDWHRSRTLQDNFLRMSASPDRHGDRASFVACSPCARVPTSSLHCHGGPRSRRSYDSRASSARDGRLDQSYEIAGGRHLSPFPPNGGHLTAR